MRVSTCPYVLTSHNGVEVARAVGLVGAVRVAVAKGVAHVGQRYTPGAGTLVLRLGVTLTACSSREEARGMSECSGIQ